MSYHDCVMLRRAAIVVSGLLFASVVLLTSIFRATAPEYAFSQPNLKQGDTVFEDEIDYYLPYPGILPDHFLWPVKAFRDKVWLLLTQDNMKRARLLLLFADKRVGMAWELARGGKSGDSVQIATKAEKYLEEAFLEQEKGSVRGGDTTDFLFTLAKAALKHQEVLEKTVVVSPDDAKPYLLKTLDYPKMVYEKSVHGLNAKGRLAPTVLPAQTEASPSSETR